MLACRCFWIVIKFIIVEIFSNLSNSWYLIFITNKSEFSMSVREWKSFLFVDLWYSLDSMKIRRWSYFRLFLWSQRNFNSVFVSSFYAFALHQYMMQRNTKMMNKATYLLILQILELLEPIFRWFIKQISNFLLLSIIF